MLRGGFGLSLRRAGPACFGLRRSVEPREAGELLGLLPLERDDIPAGGAPGEGRNLLCRRELSGGRTVVIKQWSFCGLMAGARTSIRGTKAERSFAAARMLEDMDIPTPRPLMWWWSRSGFLRAEAAYVCEEVPGACQIRALHGGDAASGSASEYRMSYIRAAGRLAARMHESGLMHHDFTAGNVLIAAGPGGERGCWLVDLNRVRPHRRISVRRGLGNLAQLEFDMPGDAGELVGIYCSVRGLDIQKSLSLYMVLMRRRMRRVRWKDRTRPWRHPLAARAARRKKS